MKVSKTVSIELDLLQRVLVENPSFSSAVTEALENWLNFKRETERGNSIHYSRTFTASIPAQLVWNYMTFDEIAQIVPMLTNIEYLSENHSGLGTRCKLYTNVGGNTLTSIAEITEYKEYEKMVFRSTGDFRLFVSATLTPKSAKTDMSLIAVIGLSDEYSSNDTKNEITRNLDTALNHFKQITMSNL